MLFNSLSFFIFFPIVATLHFFLPHKYRWAMLLLASCIFYIWFIPKYILILLTTIIIDYCAGIFIEKTDGWIRKTFLFVSIMSTCLVLFIFKYFNFFNTHLAELVRLLDWNYSVKALDIILPIGLSFHTFQGLAYVIEVYRGKQKAERHFGVYALYVMFFPQLVAGPIERPQNLLHQFYERHDFEYKRVTGGLMLMTWGLFKKTVIADRLVYFVDKVYDNPTAYSGPTLILATFFFAFQIYCDFSGYSDIAIGSAQVMGFKLMVNFNRPYFSKSISEFWKRWHISLSSWFRDYFYIALGGNRCTFWRWQLNLIVTFLVSGLWHGANSTYIIWGGLNGSYLLLELWTENIRRKVSETIGFNNQSLVLKVFQIMITFSLICFAWIFFRARSVQEAFYIVKHLFIGWSLFLTQIRENGFTFLQRLGGLELNQGINVSSIFLSLTLVVVLILADLFQRRGSLPNMLAAQPIYLRWIVYYALVLGLLGLGQYNERQFIYFQF